MSRQKMFANFVANISKCSCIAIFIMPTKNHDEYQGKTCVMCLSKCAEKKLTESLKNLLQKNVYSDYLKDEEFLGKSICEGCKKRLQSTETSSPRPIPDLDYKLLAQNVRQYTRAKSLRAGAKLECECEICRLGKLAKTAGLKVGKSAEPVKSQFLGVDMKNLKKQYM